jgi:hypothetical protein
MECGVTTQGVVATPIQHRGDTQILPGPWNGVAYHRGQIGLIPATSKSRGLREPPEAVRCHLIAAEFGPDVSTKRGNW